MQKSLDKDGVIPFPKINPNLSHCTYSTTPANLIDFTIVSKIRIGSKIRKKYDTPATLYERLLRSPDVSQNQKEMLQAKRKTLNPFELKNNLEEKLKKFFWIVEELRKMNQSTG